MPNEMALTSTPADLHRQPDLSPHQSPAAALAPAATVRSPHDMEVTMIGIAIPLSPILTISPLPDRWDGRIAAVREQFAARPWRLAPFEPAAFMEAAGWQMDQHRDERGRLHGAMPLGVERTREAA